MSEYKRLTNKDWKENYDIFEDVCCDTCAEDCGKCERNFKALVHLAELEDKIESGQAVILPCKVGDTVYVLFDPLFVADVFKMEVKAILINRKHIVVEGINDENNERYSVISDYIFMTKEAAEAKLKKLQEEHK